MKLCVKITFLFLILTVNVKAQTFSSLIKDSEIKEIIKLDIDKEDTNSKGGKNVKKELLDWKSWVSIIGINSGYIKSKRDSINQLFTESDFDYMKEQIKAEKDTVWNLSLEKGKIKENPKNKYYLYSIPLFDQKREKALIIKDYSCGSLCGKTTIEIYIKTENSWKFYKSVFLLES